MIYELLEPIFSIIEWVLVGKVEHNDTCFWESEVVIDNSSISLLSCRIPKFKIESSIRMTYFFEAIVDSDSWLLRIKLTINITDKESTFSNSWSSNYDSFIILKPCIFKLTHLLRFYIIKKTTNLMITKSLLRSNITLTKKR